MALPSFNDQGDLPPGIHSAALDEVMERFGTINTRRGGSIFWIRRLAAFDGEETTIAHWQSKRDGGQRGIIEIVAEAQ